MNWIIGIAAVVGLAWWYFQRGVRKVKQQTSHQMPQKSQSPDDNLPS